LPTQSKQEFGPVFEESSSFTVVRYRQAEPHPDGTRNRNSYFVEVEMNGAVYEVGIVRANGRAQVPEELRSHHLAQDIKKAALEFVLQDLQAKLKATWPRRMGERLARGVPCVHEPRLGE
jgi:hypothetical protein